MSAATRVPSIMKVLSAIKFSELVADLMAACMRIEMMRRRSDPRLKYFIEDVRRLLADTIRFQEDTKSEIQGLDFQRVVRRVREATGDEPGVVKKPGEKK